MALPQKLTDALAAKNFQEVESEWLSAADQSPQEIEGFIRAAETLDRLGQADKARSLLSLLDDQLKEKGLYDLRLDLLRGAGKRWVKAGTMFETVLSTIDLLYADRKEQLEILLPAVGLDGERDETPKLWDKVERLRSLLIFETGTIVAMKGKGVGVVTDVNLALQSLKIDFERQKGVSVGFRATSKMLEVLPDGHVLKRKHEDAESLTGLKPSLLLREVLQSYDRPLTGADVKEVVAGVVPTAKWTSWWTSARKHPQVLASGKGKQTYVWAATGEDAADAIWDAFEAADLAGRLDHLRRAANQDLDLLRRMVGLLSEEGRHMLSSVSPQLPIGLVVWAASEKYLDEDSDFSPKTAISEVVDLQPVLVKTDAPRARDRVYEIIREVRTDWLEIFTQRFAHETDARCLKLLASHIFEHSDEARHTAIDRVLAQPSKTPAAFSWLADQASDDEAIREYRPLRLLKQLLVALGDESFSEYRSKLSPLSESGGTVPKILSALDVKDMREAKSAIERARGLEDYQREPLITTVHLRFPSLEVVEDEPLYALPTTYKHKRDELRVMLEEEIPLNRKAIETAREMGDLRENFEYKAARQRHEYLASRASELSGQLDRTIVLHVANVNPDQVRVGTVTKLESMNNQSRTITMLGPWESDPDNGVISHESELAVRLLGKKVDDPFELQGVAYKIVRIQRYTD